MNIFPFEKVTEVPTGLGGFAEVTSSNDLIDVMGILKFQTMKATNKPYFRGLSGYLFDAQIHVGFGDDYKVVDVEVRHPFSCLEGKGIFWGELSLIYPTLQEVQDILRGRGVEIASSDVGFDAPSIGLSFYSNDYEGDLAVRLDAITFHLQANQ